MVIYTRNVKLVLEYSVSLHRKTVLALSYGFILFTKQNWGKKEKEKKNKMQTMALVQMR